MQKLLNYIILPAFFAAIMGSCITARDINYMQPAGGGISAYVDSLSFSDYKLKRGDYLYIKVYSIDENLTEILNGAAVVGDVTQSLRVGESPVADLFVYLIDRQGNIDFPLTGKIRLTGKTLREANREIEKKLANVLSEFSIDIQIVKKYFSVIGQDKSGRFPITKEKMTIFEALAMTGDLGNYSDRSKIQLIREIDGKTLIKTFDIRSVDIINSEFYYVEPNDILYVPTMRNEFFGISNLTGLISFVLTTYSFGFWVYKLAKPTQ
ncbi:MAG: polysaccharide biosynthesis/export family protein [Prevotellaceae bacterium]|jgi:polysaccharide export outer membrane protein|nr:polysaccharide biosynthesis/export family protein [Prevotellaceae bacterium]